LSPTRLVFVFPAFASDYTDHPGNDLPGFFEQFNLFLYEAGNRVDPSLAEFDFESKNYLGDELITQYITYLYSCAASKILREKQIKPEYSAGYSMGIYAALFDAGSINLETGLRFIQYAYQSLKSEIGGTAYGMGTLIGLDKQDIEQLIRKSNFRIEITNQNASHSFVVSGLLNDVSEMLLMAREEGALHARSFTVSVPYHYSRLEKGALFFAQSIVNLEISPPSNPVISLIDQRELKSPDDLRKELTSNLYHPLNWLKTQHWLQQKGICRFIECGPSKGLAKNARFIEGDYRFITLDDVTLHN
jgi:malonyl CoA-acyl carrier protein transacylase